MQECKCNGIKITDLDSKEQFTGNEYLVVAEKDSNYKIPMLQVGSTILDNNNFKASIESVYTSSTPIAQVKFSNNEFKFSFGIPAGEKGDKGRDGIDGVDGVDGKDGIDGAPGIDGDTTRTIAAFKSTSTTVRPATPVGGSWDYATNEITYPNGWSGNDTNELGYVWRSEATFSSNDTMVVPWCTPVRITGDTGQPGVDGTNIQFVYKLTITSFVKPDPDRPTGSQEEAVEQGWTDHPTGISELYQCEWVSSRTRDLDTGLWSLWEPCSIWSRWGVNGQDGDGREYIFQRTSTPMPPQDITDNNPDEDEYIPSSAPGEEPWTDNPTGVNNTYKWEWVSQRKYKGSTKKWSNFSSPSLWAKLGDQGQDGNSIRVMYTVTSSSSVKPRDPDRLNINPGSIWSQAMPNATGIEAIWGIQALVTFDNELVIDTNLPVGKRGWQGPYLITGVPGIDAADFNYNVEVFKESSATPLRPTNNDPKNPNNGWKLTVDSEDGIWWKCIGTVLSLTGTVIEWGAPIKQTATGFNIEGSLGSYDELISLPIENLKEGDAYIIDGVLWVWNGSTWIASGNIQGPQGPLGPQGPQGPAGDNGTTPNWRTYVYKQSDTRPSAPTSTDIIPAGWSDYPTSDGQWWLCIGEVNGPTNKVISWSGVLPVNGRDGIAQDGKYYEFRFATSNSATQAPTVNLTVREPAGWNIKLPTVNAGLFLWMIMAQINPNNTLVDKWEGPTRISGEKGDTGSQGPTGNFTEYIFARNNSWDTAPTLTQTRNPAGWSTQVPAKTSGKVLWATFATINGSTGALIGNWAEPYYMTGATGGYGASGAPGVGYEVRYCKGTETSYTGEQWQANWTKREPTGWTKTVPELVQGDQYNYIWFMQVRIINDLLEDGSYWSKPNPMGGIITPDPVTLNPIVYPAGLYRLDQPYINDGNTAPYVFDTNGDSEGNHYFLLNDIFPATNPWIGTQLNNKRPGQSNSWVPFKNYEALYAAVGILGNALVGGAVFNNNLMFSLRGKNASNADVSDYQNINITPNPSNPDAVDTSYVMDTTNSFRPNFLLDFKNGEAYFGAGGIHLARDSNSSSIELYNTTNKSKLTLNSTGLEINRIDSSGNLALNPLIAKIDNTGLEAVASGEDTKRTSLKVSSDGLDVITNKTVFNIGEKHKWQHLKCNLDGSGSLADGNITWDILGNLYATVIYETINVMESIDNILLPTIATGLSKSYVIATPTYTRIYMGHKLNGSFKQVQLYSKTGSGYTSYAPGLTMTLESDTVYCFAAFGNSNGTLWKIYPLI